MTAEWSVHGFAEPKKSSVEETHTLGGCDSTNNDESIFITVTNCHKKALTHAPARAPTDAQRQTPAPTNTAAAAPPTSLARARASPARRRQLPRRTAAHRNDMHTTAYIQTYNTTGATASTDSARPSHTQMCHMSQGSRKSGVKIRTL